MKLQSLFVTALMAVSSAAFAAGTPKIPAGTYHIDPAHTKMGFEVPHMVISSVEGKFDQFAGNIVVGKKLQDSKADVEIQTASVDTGNSTRDNHLRSADFFDAQKFPALTFKSSKVEFKGTRIKVPGELTIKGVTQPVMLEGKLGGVIKDMAGDDRMAAQLETKINRKDFGLNWNKMIEAGPAVGDTVTIQIQFEAVRKK
jgi:polyisoprenoid-binding protein YceI